MLGAIVMSPRRCGPSPGNAATLDSMGWVEYRAGHLPAALGWLERAWEAARDPEIAAHLGEVLWMLGRHDDARAIWAEGERLDADHSVLTETRQRLEGAPVPEGVD